MKELLSLKAVIDSRNIELVVFDEGAIEVTVFCNGNTELAIRKWWPC